jgi:3-phytase
MIMTRIPSWIFYVPVILCVVSCETLPPDVPYSVVPARLVTEPVKWDSDDPAIWIDAAAPEKSLVLGTDKNTDGAIYAFDLSGKTLKRVGGLKRPNNIDIAYGFRRAGRRLDIAVVTEREAQRLRVLSLPDLELIDGGDLVVFNGDKSRAPMGIALYTRPADEALFAIVGGKSGPLDGYLAQYRIEADSLGKISMRLVREFGHYSGKKEIESIAVDNELGYVYYSDETVGVRKYHADPDAADADKELALFAGTGFESDHEGISIYKLTPKTGYILVSDQQADRFWIYAREGTPDNPDDHRLLKIIKASTHDSDGSEITSVPLMPAFPSGLFVAMSGDKTFHYFSWEDIAGDDLKSVKLNASASTGQGF